MNSQNSEHGNAHTPESPTNFIRDAIVEDLKNKRFTSVITRAAKKQFNHETVVHLGHHPVPA
jgi:hypothetical protein